MYRKIGYFIFIILILFTFTFLFSGCDLINQILNPGGKDEGNNPGEGEISENAKHILLNWDFSDTHSYDSNQEFVFENNIVYNNDDYIENWMEYENQNAILFNNAKNIDGHFRVDLGNFPGGYGGIDNGATNAYLKLFQYIDDTEDTVETDLAQNINYTVKSNSKYRIKIKINDFQNGNAPYPFLYVLVTINGTKYVLMAASPDGPSKWNGLNVISSYSNWDIIQGDLDGLEVDTFPGIWGSTGSTYTIRAGDVIESVIITVGSNLSDVYIDYVDIYEE